MKKPIDLVMFDLDGTLADTGQDLADAVNHTRAHFNLEPLSDALVYTHVGRGVEHLLRHSLPEDSADHFQEVMRVFLERYESHLLDKTVLYPGVHEVLDYFRDKRRVVVSNKMHRLTVAVLRGLGVEKQFDAILGGDSVAEKKPHPALIHDVLERFLAELLQEGCALEKPQADLDPHGGEIVDHGLADARAGEGLARELARVEAIGIAGLGQELA